MFGFENPSGREFAEAVRGVLRVGVGQGVQDLLELGNLGAGDVTAFVVARCPGQPSGAAKQTVTALRSLLVWLHVEGEIGRPLAAAVPSVAGWRHRIAYHRLQRHQSQPLETR